MKSLLVISVFLGLSHGIDFQKETVDSGVETERFQCYACSGEGCEDPYVPLEEHIINCTIYTGKTHPMCRTLVGADGVTKRDCHKYFGDFNPMDNACRTFGGTKRKCCTTTLCNGPNGSGVVVLSLTLFTLSTLTALLLR